MKLVIPYPILLVLGGLVLGFTPGLPRVEIDPELIFVVFLPPLVTSAAWYIPLRDFRIVLVSVLLLSTGLVLATTSVVAVVAHAVLGGIPWSAAFVLGSVVSPTDSVAATAIAQKLGVPRRMVTLLEGESLVNNATGLVTYRFAQAAKEAGVPYVVAKASSEVHSKLLQRVGADYVVYPEHEADCELARSLTQPAILDQFDLDVDHSIAKLILPEEFHSKTIAELQLLNLYGLDLLAVSQDDKLQINPDPSLCLEEGSTNIVLGSNKDISRLPI